jgi:hypothetical protein
MRETVILYYYFDPMPMHKLYPVFFKFQIIVGVEVSIVNALVWLRIIDQLFKSYVLHE